MLNAAIQTSAVLSLARNLSGEALRLLQLTPRMWKESVAAGLLKSCWRSVKTYFRHSLLKGLVLKAGLLLRQGAVRITPEFFTDSRVLILSCSGFVRIKSFCMRYFAFSSLRRAATRIKLGSSVNLARAAGIVITSAVIINTAFLYFFKDGQEGRGIFLRALFLFTGCSAVFLPGEWRKAVDNSIVFRAVKIFIAKF